MDSDTLSLSMNKNTSDISYLILPKMTRRRVVSQLNHNINFFGGEAPSPRIF